MANASYFNFPHIKMSIILLKSLFNTLSCKLNKFYFLCIPNFLAIIYIIHYITYLRKDSIHDFSVWFRTGSNPVDNNCFESILENTL